MYLTVKAILYIRMQAKLIEYVLQRALKHSFLIANILKYSLKIKWVEGRDNFNFNFVDLVQK